MLTGLLSAGAAALLAASAVAVVPAAAHAAAQVACAPGRYAAQIAGEWVCVLVARGSEHSSAEQLHVEEVTGGGAFSPWCPAGIGPSGYDGAPEGMVPCYDKARGWYDSVNCYYRREDRPAAEGMIGYDEYGSDGLVYHLFCFVEDFSFPDALWIGGGHFRVLPEPPDFEGGQPPTVLTLWMEAVNQLVMTGPQIGTAPPQDQGAALVRLPVWFWHDGERSTGPATAGPAGGQTVRAEAALTTIEWDPGDGSSPVQCDEWTAWRQGLSVMDPPCGYAYARASRSQPGGAYQLTATATWHLQWWINDEWDGELFLAAAATGQLVVDEIQVVTSR